MTALNFLSLPAEIRRNVYNQLFEPSVVWTVPEVYRLTNGRTRTNSFLDNYQTSAQVLMVCASILEEAQPILYGNMTFEVPRYGRLPDIWTHNNFTSQFIRHVRVNVAVSEASTFVQRSQPEYRPIIASLHMFDVECTAMEWIRPTEAPAPGVDEEYRPGYDRVHSLLRMCSMEMMAGSRMDQMNDYSEPGETVRFVVEEVAGDAVSYDKYHLSSC